MATGTIINGPSGATGARIEGGDQTSAVWISGAATVINYATIVGVENRGDPEFTLASASAARAASATWVRSR